MDAVPAVRFSASAVRDRRKRSLAPLSKIGESARRQRKMLEAGHVESRPDLLGAAILRSLQYRSLYRCGCPDHPEEIDPTSGDRPSEGKEPGTVHGLLALARLGDKEDRDAIPATLCALLLPGNRAEELAQLRLATVVIARMGDPEDYLRQSLLTRFDRRFPRRDGAIDRLLGDLLVRLKAPNLAPRLLSWLEEGLSGEDRMAALRALQWVPLSEGDRTRIAPALKTLRSLSGGNSYTGFIDGMARQLDDGEGDLIPSPAPPPVMPPFVQRWDRESILEALSGPAGRATRDCSPMKNRSAPLPPIRWPWRRCGSRSHRIASRFTSDDLITAILEPSRDISDQYNWSEIEFGEDGMRAGCSSRSRPIG